jgi:hypothetical protein
MRAGRPVDDFVLIAAIMDIKSPGRFVRIYLIVLSSSTTIFEAN